MTVRLTTGQAIVRYLMNQYVEFDGTTEQFFAGCWGIFGHGNIGGIAQGLQQAGPTFPYYLARNEQSMVNTAIGFAKLSNRRRTFACLTSIGPGATNMVTGAATATVNRIPVLLLTGDTFAERLQDPVLQQLVSERDGTLVGQRRLPTRRALLRSDLATRADHRLASRGDAHPDLARRHRRRLHLGAPGRADVRVRLPRGILPTAHVGDPAPAPRRDIAWRAPPSGSARPNGR